MSGFRACCSLAGSGGLADWACQGVPGRVRLANVFRQGRLAEVVGQTYSGRACLAEVVWQMYSGRAPLAELARQTYSGRGRRAEAAWGEACSGECRPGFIPVCIEGVKPVRATEIRLSAHMQIA